MKLINNIRRFGDNVSRWFSYLPVLWRAYDFDYSSILSVERHQIKRVRDSINHYRNHVNWEQDVASMNLALRLLDIIEENGEAELLCDEPFKFKDNGYLELNPDAKWKMERYVNTTNASRFTALSFKIVFHFGEYYYFIASTHVFLSSFFMISPIMSDF